MWRIFFLYILLIVKILRNRKLCQFSFLPLFFFHLLHWPQTFRFFFFFCFVIITHNFFDFLILPLNFYFSFSLAQTPIHKLPYIFLSLSSFFSYFLSKIFFTIAFPHQCKKPLSDAVFLFT